MGLPSNFYGGNNMKKTLSIVLSLLFMGIFSPAIANTIKWSMPGDSLTLDPHAQNEGPTHMVSRQVYESLVTRELLNFRKPDETPYELVLHFVHADQELKNHLALTT